MIVSRTPISRGFALSEISARLLPRLLPLALLSAFVSPTAFAQYQTYPIYTGVGFIPAGSYGAAFVASVNDSSSTPNFNVCFDTGYGSSKVPIVPFGYVNFGSFSQFNFVVPPSTIQAVPPSAFVNGSFNVSIYSIPTNFTACNGNEAGAPQGNTVTLNYPVLNTVSLPDLPEQNVAIAGREPSRLALTGSNFLGNSGTSGKVPSAVNFISSTTLSGSVGFISSYALTSTIPTTIPAAAASVSIQVCNTATYSYCSNSLALETAPLRPNPGTITASPSPAYTTQPVTLTARFGPATRSTAGAPSGPVTFGYWGKVLGTANLVLDKTATFAQAPPQQFLTYALPISPIVADFNRDGIPDTLFIDPGTANSGSSLHLLLGTVPSGSFQADRQFYVLSDGPSFSIYSAAVGDFNGDGVPDIVLLANNSDSGVTSLYTMLGNGDGTFQDGTSSSPTLYGSQIVAGDFNKDGKQDIVIAGALDGNGTIGLQAFLGDGTGNFTSGPATTGLRTAPSPYFGDFKVAAADFNADGYPDVAVMNGYSPEGQLDNSIEVYQNTGSGSFAAPVRVQTDGTATANFSIAALGPGLPPDLIVTSTASQYPGVYVALNQSTAAKITFFGTFQFTQVPGITQAVVGDFDGDGLLDVAVDDQATIHVLSGNGFGAFAATYSNLSIVPPGTTLIAATDENGDKYADLLLYTAGAQNGNAQYPITLYDYITAGTATAVFPPVNFPAGTQPLYASTNGTFNILPGKATGTLIVTAPPASTVNLAASPVSPANYGTVAVTLTATIPVTDATGTVSFYSGTALLGSQQLADAASSTASFTTSLLPAATYSFKAVYGGDTTHGGGTSAIVPYVVSPVPATVSWTPNPATIVYGTPLSAAQLDATATGISGAAVAGSLTYSPALGTVLAAGTQTLSAVFTPTDTTDFTSVTTTATINVTVATPALTWLPSPATLAYGTPLSAAQLDATSSAPGTFAYTPAPGAVLGVGTQTLTAVFTPTDSKDFKSVTATTTIIVTAATPAVTWTPSPATFTYGTPLSVAQLDANSATPGTFAYSPALGTVLPAGTQTLSVLFTPSDTIDYKSVTATATVTVTAATPTVIWTPNPATITYGTALSAGQLDASSSTPGTFSYNPPSGTLLAAGTQTLSALFTPTDSKNFKSVTATATITVGQAVPVIAWATPASIIAGTALSGAQLNATATGVTGAALPGVFSYTPVAGTVPAAGTQTLKVTFTPTDLANYTTAIASVSLQVIPVTLTALSSTSAQLGDPAKTITLTGTGFVPGAVVQVNGTAIPTTFVNATTLTATIPAADFLMVQTLQISVTEASQNQTTSSVPFTVAAPLANAVLSGPSSISPGAQTSLTLKLANPYPVDLTATYTLSFTPAAGLPNDPAVVFASGGTTYVQVIAANSDSTSVAMIQGGTIAGTINVTLTLEAGGANVTPSTLQPVVISAPLAAPGIRSVTLTPSGNTLSVAVHGFSNPRDMTFAKFHFTPVPGGSIGDEDVTIDVGSLFTTWYADPASRQYGSAFTYTQIFNLSSDAAVVGQVTVTLTNSVGVSPDSNTP
jgi:hypothetical protein